MKLGKHKSMDCKVKLSVGWLEGLGYVAKVILGRSESCRHKYAPGSIRLTAEVPAGFKAKLYGGTGITDAFIYVDSQRKQSLKSDIDKRFWIG